MELAAAVFLIMLLFVPAASLLYGQTTQGAILGSITDPAGAMVPDVEVEVTSLLTGFNRKAATDSTGFYLVDHLEPGTYSVTATAHGFKKTIRPSVTLATNAQVRVDLRLEVAQTNEQVTISDVTPVIETDSSRISTTLDRNAATFSSLPGRTSFDLLLSTPAAFWSGDGYSVQGTRAPHTGFSLDGVSFTNEQGGSMQTAYYMDNESTQEFRVNSVNNSAEYKYSAVVEQSTRGGTNTLHGEANFEHNDSALNAKGFFAATKAVTRSNQFYAAIGGPVYIPKLYDGHNRTFFYFHYENSISPGANNSLLNVPTDQMRAGNFSAVSTPILDPATGSPFPGNIIPSNRLNASALKYLQLFYPKANFGDPLVAAQNFNAHYVQDGKTPTYNGRIDQRIGDKLTFYGRFLFNDQRVRQNDNGLPVQYLGNFRNDQTSGSYLLAATYIFSPSVVSETRASYARMWGIYQNFTNGNSVVEKVGLTGYPAPVTPNAFGVPAVQIAGLLGMQTTDYRRPVDHHWDIYENVSIRHGSHAFKTGFNYLSAWVTRFPTSPSAQLGSFNFSGFATGLGFSDYILGIPQTASWSTEVSPYYGTRSYIGAYLQDDWKIHRNLTVNLGIRYEYGNPFSEQSHRIFNFDPATGSLVVPNEKTLAMVSPVFPKNIPIITASQAGFPASTLIRSDKNNVAPRVGFAYRSPLWGLVMRGGYGIFYSLEYQRAFGDMTSGPFVGTQTYDNHIVNGAPLWTWPSVVPAGVPPNSLGIQDVSGVAVNLPASYMQQWNLSLDKQIGNNGFRLSYIGEASVHLPYGRNLNQPVPSTTPYSPDLRPYPDYRNITFVDAGGGQSYNSLQFELTRRLSNGLMINSSYSWTKDITDVQDVTALGDVIENAYCRRCDRGNEEFTPRHRFLTNLAYQLPFGKGRRFLSDSNGFVQAVLGGWTTANYVVFSSGSWDTPTFTGADISNTNQTSGRPDRICDGNLSNPDFPSRGFDVGCFVRPPAGIGRFGNSGVGIIQGPWQNGWSTNVFKYFFVGEKVKFRVQANFINVLNHPIFGWVIPGYGGDAGLNIESPSAGRLCCQLTDQAGDYNGNRTIVVGAKIEF
jgi:hypothetical protein